MTIETFQEKVMQLKPNNFMGLNGAGAGIVGSMDSGASAVLDLQRAAIEFVRLYKTSGIASQIHAAKKEVVAKVMVAHTLDAINERQADELIEAAQAFIKERK